MNLLIGGNGADESRKTDVLNNEGIGLQGDDFLQKFGQFLQFTLENQHVHGQESAHSANAGVADHVADLVERKVFGAASGIPVGNSKVNRIGPVFNGGFEHFAGSHRQKKFRRCHCTIHVYKDRKLDVNLLFFTIL